MLLFQLLMSQNFILQPVAMTDIVSFIVKVEFKQQTAGTRSSFDSQVMTPFPSLIWNCLDPSPSDQNLAIGEQLESFNFRTHNQVFPLR
jgi:hypothetical protein